MCCRGFGGCGTVSYQHTRDLRAKFELARFILGYTFFSSDLIGCSLVLEILLCVVVRSPPFRSRYIPDVSGFFRTVKKNA